MTLQIQEEPEPESMQTNEKTLESGRQQQQTEEQNEMDMWQQFSRSIFDLQNKVRKDPKWFSIHLKK